MYSAVDAADALKILSGEPEDRHVSGHVLQMILKILRQLKLKYEQLRAGQTVSGCGGCGC